MTWETPFELVAYVTLCGLPFFALLHVLVWSISLGKFRDIWTGHLKCVNPLPLLMLGNYTTIEPGLDIAGLVNAVFTTLGPGLGVLLGFSIVLSVIWAGLRWTGHIGG